MHILFVTATRIGDAVLSTGLLVLSDRAPSDGAADDRRGAGGGSAVRSRAAARADRWSSRSGAGRCIGCRFTRAVATRRWDLVVDLRGSALAWLLRAGERRVMAKGDAREHRVRQLGRLFDLDPPPSPRLWTAPHHERAAERADLAGRSGVGDRSGGQLARQAMAGRALRRARAAADRADGPLPGARVAVLAAAHERAQAEPVARGDPAGSAHRSGRPRRSA